MQWEKHGLFQVTTRTFGCAHVQRTITQAADVSRVRTVQLDQPPRSAVHLGTSVKTMSWRHRMVRDSHLSLKRDFIQNILSLSLSLYQFPQTRVKASSLSSSSKQFHTGAEMICQRWFFFTGECDAGFYCPGGQDARDPALFSCTAGHYCLLGSANPEPCPNGTFSNTTGNYELANCLPCSPGKTWHFIGL